MDHLIMKAMMIWFSSMILQIIFPTHVSGTYKVKAVCGEVMVGKPFELTCNIISGSVSKGINWFVSGKPNAIILCKVSGKCSNRNDPLYSTKDVEDNKQQFTILNVTKHDLNRTWTCVDGLTAKSPGFSSCRLKDIDKIKTRARNGAIIAGIVMAFALGMVSVIIYCLYKDRLKLIRIYGIYCILELVIISIVFGVATYFVLLNTRLLYAAAVAMDIVIFAVASVIKIILVIRRVFSKWMSKNYDTDGSPSSFPLK